MSCIDCKWWFWWEVAREGYCRITPGDEGEGDWAVKEHDDGCSNFEPREVETEEDQ